MEEIFLKRIRKKKKLFTKKYCRPAVCINTNRKNFVKFLNCNNDEHLLSMSKVTFTVIVKGIRMI